MKRIKRKQLKENEFASTLVRVYNFLSRNTKVLIIAGGVIVFSGLVFLGAKVYKVQLTKQETKTLTQILKLKPELGENKESVAKLKELAGEGKFGRLAYLELASYWIEEGELDEAESALHEIEKGQKDLIYYKAKDLLVRLFIKEKKYDKAIQVCEEVEKLHPQNYPLDVFLFHKALAHEKKGEMDKALTIYRKIEEQYPQTLYGYDASQKIKNLE